MISVVTLTLLLCFTRKGIGIKIFEFPDDSPDPDVLSFVTLTNPPDEPLPGSRCFGALGLAKAPVASAPGGGSAASVARGCVSAPAHC